MKQRDIKFRIWDKKEEWWLFDYKEMGGFALLGEVVLVEGIREIPVERLEDFEVMQFTGLLDKNGKEIYEGDICKSNGHKDSIKWEHGRWKFWVEDCLECYNNTSLKLEVVGNIYENPELLKGDK